MIPRYKHEKIADIWSTDNKLAVWLGVELAHLSALNSNITERTISQKEYETIVDNIKIDKNRWKEIEKETKHDVQAFIQMLEESIPDNSGRWIHFGLTSSDIIDTSLTIMCRDSLKEIANQCASCIYYVNQLLNKKESKCSILSRTHGKAAEIQTYRNIFLRWQDFLRRAYDEVLRAQKIVNKGKLSGASGNYTTNSLLNENIALNVLGLRSLKASQIIPRDVYLNYFYSILKVNRAYYIEGFSKLD